MNPPPSPEKPKRVVIENHSWRNTFIAVGIGLVLLVFVGYGVMHMGSPVKGNKLTGVVVKKIFTKLQERQVTFSGRKMEGVREIAGEFVLQVRVDAQNRTYDVPVEQYVYESKNVGDSLTFLRPASEQR